VYAFSKFFIIKGLIMHMKRFFLFLICLLSNQALPMKNEKSMQTMEQMKKSNEEKRVMSLSNEISSAEVPVTPEEQLTKILRLTNSVRKQLDQEDENERKKNEKAAEIMDKYSKYDGSDRYTREQLEQELQDLNNLP
jgi:hypothetical protein